MRFEIGMHTLWTGGAGPGTGPAPTPPSAVRQVIENLFTQVDPPLPTGRLREKRRHYDLLLRQAFALGRATNAIHERYTLADDYRPSKGNPDDGWDPIDGVSVEVIEDPLPFPAAAQFKHYLSIAAKSLGAPGQATCTWLLENTTGLVVVGLTSFLSHSRSRLLEAEVSTPQEMNVKQVLDPRSHGSMRNAEFEHPVQPGEVIKLTWTYKGDPPHVRAFTWWTLVGATVPHPTGDPAAPPLVVPRRMVSSLFQYARSAGDEFLLRQQLIAGIQDRTRKGREFFFDLDRQTQPGPGTTTQLTLLSSYLRSRYLVRAEDAGFGDLATFDPLECELWRSGVVPVANLLEALLRQHFSDQAGTLDLDRVAESFDQFAGGQLTDLDTHGAPNGVNFFAFCEFAILCVELRHQERFWRELIPIFARASEIFARCYHECCGPRTSCGYRVAHNPSGARGFTDAERVTLLQAWQGVDGIEGFSRIVNAALEDELYPGTVTPFGLEDKCVGGDPVCGPRRPRDRSSRLRTMP